MRARSTLCTCRTSTTARKRRNICCIDTSAPIPRQISELVCRPGAAVSLVAQVQQPVFTGAGLPGRLWVNIHSRANPDLDLIRMEASE